MSRVHLNHIRGELENNVTQYIDTSDIEQLSIENIEQVKISRAYALFTLKSLTAIDYIDIKDSITDGFKDEGIDCLFYDRITNLLYIIQSKWINSAKGGPSKGKVLKLFDGVDKLTNLDFESFNDKIKNKKDHICKVLYNSQVKIKVIFSYSGTNIATDILGDIDNRLQKYNDVDEVISFEEFNLTDAHRSLKLSLDGDPINIEFDILKWGQTSEPIKLIYGQINCKIFADLYGENRQRLFSQNIRGFMGESDINKQIIKSIVESPSNFFYLNNGITMLAKNISRAAAGIQDHNLGKFYCEDITIVNGAQTVGSIFEASKLNKKEIEQAYILVRIISLEDCPEDFDRLVTVATNTQNKIEKKDFVSLDSEQHRLKMELQLDGINYNFKRDDPNQISAESDINLETATLAMACAYNDIDLSTYAKREIGKLWENTEKPPYTLIFNNDLSSKVLLKTVQIYREIEKTLKEIQWGVNEYKTLISIHAYYVIQHLVFQNLGKNLINDPNRVITEDDINNIRQQANIQNENVYKMYIKLFSKNHFPNTVFKNATNVRKIKEEIYISEGKTIPGVTLDLFE